MGKKTRTFSVIAVLAAVYFAAGKLALILALARPAATAAWPCAGIALAALLLYGYEVWPGVLLASFLLHFPAAGSALVCLGIAAGNTLEALAGAWMVNRYAGGRYPLGCARHVFRFSILAGAFSPAIGATAGATSLVLGGSAPWASWEWTHYVSLWSAWWLGDAVGIVLVAPLILAWFFEPRLSPLWETSRRRIFEAAALLACLIVTGLVVFNGVFSAAGRDYPLEYLGLPLLLWAAIRLGRREAAGATLLLAGLATAGAYRGFGPFLVGSRNESQILLLAFLAISAVTTLAVGALFAERRRAEEQAQSLAVRDHLTGLGNYRRLHEALEAEIRRSDRTGRPFAFVLMDLDGLKQVNDAYGHPAGSRALCRLAEVLRMHSRNIDIAARYGGDEFGLVMPEADAAIAYQVGQRICERVANDGQFPPITASVGHAVWPDDGRTFEALVQAADHALYTMKLKAQPENGLKRERALAARNTR